MSPIDRQIVLGERPEARLINGVENLPAALIGLLARKNVGKRMVRV
ncbi:MAG: hypothetical protein ACR2F8_04460 [Caulobacteraceae bacterium]